MKLDDLTGKKFTRLKVLRRANRYNKKTMWECVCDCGKKLDINAAYLKNGRTKSCGCYSHDIHKKRLTTHGKSNTRLYRIWAKIRDRCSNPSSSRYRWYGLKGVSLCEEWANDFKKFYEWSLKNGYSDNLTIERVNHNSDYSPENCEWITRTDNSRKARIDNGPRTKLLPHQVVMSRVLRSFGVMYSSIGTMFNASQSSVRSAVVGKTWSKLGPNPNSFKRVEWKCEK